MQDVRATADQRAEAISALLEIENVFPGTVPGLGMPKPALVGKVAQTDPDILARQKVMNAQRFKAKGTRPPKVPKPAEADCALALGIPEDDLSDLLAE